VQWRASGSLGTLIVKKYTSPTGGWSEWSSTVVAPANATTARIIMTLGSLNTTVYVDSFEFVAIQ
jgi:hypothetical protein